MNERLRRLVVTALVVSFQYQSGTTEVVTTNFSQLLGYGECRASPTHKRGHEHPR
jgi:hypothetical protein